MKLGSDQKQFLEFLRESKHGYSTYLCGWVWKNNSTSVRHCEALVKKGLARKTTVRHAQGFDYDVYQAI